MWSEPQVVQDEGARDVPVSEVPRDRRLFFFFFFPLYWGWNPGLPVHARGQHPEPAPYVCLGEEERLTSGRSPH
jgi:hypothetical protein